MKQQTAVEYLINEISDILGRIETTPMQDLLMIDVVNKSKEMEKEKMIEFACSVFDINYKTDASFRDTAEQYYNETFKNK